MVPMKFAARSDIVSRSHVEYLRAYSIAGARSGGEKDEWECGGGPTAKERTSKISRGATTMGKVTLLVRVSRIAKFRR